LTQTEKVEFSVSIDSLDPKAMAKEYRRGNVGVEIGEEEEVRYASILI
jgi:hypothetical protein